VKPLTIDPTGVDKRDRPSSILPDTWEDFSRLYPLYEALARDCGLPAGPYFGGPKSSQWPGNRDRDLRWLDEVDGHIQAVQLRRFLATPAAAREDGLRLLLQRHLLKREKLRTDRDKVDLLVVQYFVLCASQELIAGRVDGSDVARVVRPVLGAVEPARLECSDALNCILDAAQQCRSLRDFMEQGLLEQGRLVKESIGERFYDPAALIWICRFNFLLRRSFIHLLHADLRAIGAALKELEKRNIKFVDCRRAGLSTEEPIARLRQFHERWKLPFQADYSQNSAFQPYEQLMSLREDLEDALNPAAAPPASTPIPEASKGGSPQREMRSESPREQHLIGGPTPVAPAPPKPSISEAGNSGKAASPTLQVQAPSSHGPAEGAPFRDAEIPATGAIDIEALEEKIWEQLIASPPARGRSMTTVTVENTRILLSAWEVAAFVSESGNDSSELRRVIVARAMLSMAIERRKRLMDFKILQQAVSYARGEVPRFQERVDQFKRSSKTDGAVNLGISLKRLLSLIEEAELLQKGTEGQRDRR
jgi:hypothetical protein